MPSVRGVLLFLDEFRLEQQVDLAFQSPALVVVAVHGTGKLDEFPVEALVRLLLPDLILDIPELFVHRFQGEFQPGQFSFRIRGPVGDVGKELELPPGTLCVGGGAVRYRAILEDAGGEVPPDESDLHVPWARLHASLARDFGPAELVEPIYLRVPDADRAVTP